MDLGQKLQFHLLCCPFLPPYNDNVKKRIKLPNLFFFEFHNFGRSEHLNLTLPDSIFMFVDQKAKIFFKKGKDRKVVILRPFLPKW